MVRGSIIGPMVIFMIMGYRGRVFGGVQERAQAWEGDGDVC